MRISDSEIRRPRFITRECHSLVYVLFCFIACFPIVMLEFLSRLNVKLSEIDSFDAFESVLNKSSDFQIAKGIGTALATLLATFVLYFLHVGPAFRNLLKLMKQLAGYDQQKISLIDITSSLWGFFTAISYAEIAGETLTFLGRARHVFFYLTLATHYATRSYGIKKIFQLLFDKDRAKLNRLMKSDSTRNISVPINMAEGDVDGRVLAALQGYIAQLHSQSPSDSGIADSSSLCSCYKLLMAIIFVANLFSTLPLNIEKFLKGVNSLIGTHFGESSNFQASSATIPSSFFVMPTTFFYAIANIGYVTSLRRVWFEVRRDVNAKQYRSTAFTLAAAFFIAFIGYFNGYGAYYLIKNMAADGSLRYLGLSGYDSTETTIFANNAFFCTAGLCASGLQKYYNEYSFFNKSRMTTVDHESANHLVGEASPEEITRLSSCQ